MLLNRTNPLVSGEVALSAQGVIAKEEECAAERDRASQRILFTRCRNALKNIRIVHVVTSLV